MTEFLRGWNAAHEALALKMVEVADTLHQTVPDLPSEVLDGFITIWEGMTFPAYQVSQDRGYHGARNTDPETSHRAVKNRPVNWDTQRGIALRIHYENPAGLNDWEVFMMAERLPCGGLPRDANWKRIGELRTDYDPPLIAPVTDEYGQVVTRPGKNGHARTVYAITPEGKQYYEAMRSRHQAEQALDDILRAGKENRDS
jgi:hypothetical protein